MKHQQDIDRQVQLKLQVVEFLTRGSRVGLQGQLRCQVAVILESYITRENRHQSARKPVAFGGRFQMIKTFSKKIVKYLTVGDWLVLLATAGAFLAGIILINC